jgi:hypothetical protein
MKLSKFRSTWLPIILTLLTLVLFNAGLYLRLSPTVTATAAPSILPVTDAFDSPTLNKWKPISGDWAIHNNTLEQTNTGGSDLGIVWPLQIDATQPYQFQVDVHFLAGSNAGLLFNLQQITGRQQSHMIRFNVDQGVVYIIYGFFNDAGDFNGQGSVRLDIAPSNQDWQTLAVQIGPDSYNVLLGGQVKAKGISLHYRGGSVGLITSNSHIAFDNVSIQQWLPNTSPTTVPAASTGATARATAASGGVATQVAVVAAGTPVTGGGQSLYSDRFVAGVSQANWIPFAGDWQFEAGAIVQHQLNGYDLGVAYRDPFDAVDIKVSLQHRTGFGGGLMFNMPQRNSVNGSSMVRYTEDGKGLTWGTFDAKGTFAGKGYAAVPLAGTDAHQLEVIVAANAYSIQLDGVSIAPNVPITMVRGYIALIASQSVTAFTAVDLLVPGGAATSVATIRATASATAVATLPATRAATVSATTAATAKSTQATIPGATVAATAAPGDLTLTPQTTVGLNPINGKWSIKSGIITQTDNAQADAIAGVGVSADTFRVSVDVALPSDVTDAGGGIVFHMSSRDSPAIGTMVRFGNGGQLVFWGTYDDKSQFLGQGSVPVGQKVGGTHNLALIVRASNYDILVDGKAVVTRLPLTVTTGWLGLIAFRGTVTFSNFQLSLGAE